MEKKGDAGRCFCIDDFDAPTVALEGIRRQMMARQMPFRCFGESGTGQSLHNRLQSEYQRYRAGSDSVDIVAAGGGCAGALALSEQLPVRRLALAWPEERAGTMGGEVARLWAFAARNLAFCVSEVLVVMADDGRARKRLASMKRSMPQATFRAALMPVEEWMGRWRMGGERVPSAVCDFLCGQEFAKPLAEIPEMCIIYV